MKVQFVKYMHDDAEVSENIEELIEQSIPEHIAEAIAESRPFHEISLLCEYDTDTQITTVLRTGGLP